MTRSHRIPASLAAALVLTASMFTLPTAQAAPGDIYEGFVIHTPAATPTDISQNYLYVARPATPSATTGEAAYCFNSTKTLPPAVGAATARPTYVEEDGTAANFAILADHERLTGNALVSAVESVIYNGYGNDKAGLQAAYGLTDAQFHDITQTAIWYYTDSGASTRDGTADMNAALANLLGLAQSGNRQIPLVSPPATMGLDLFANRKHDGYQNLLSASFTPAPTEVAPAVTTTARDRADSDKQLAATGGVVIDTVTYTGLNVGETYTVRGSLRNKATGAPTGITSTTTFTATSRDGHVDLAFSVPAAQAGQTLVAFEQVLDVQGALVARHEDITSIAQSVTVARATRGPRPGTPPRPTVKTVTFGYQIDQWTVRTTPQRRAVAKVLSLPGRIYTYRADVTLRNGRVWSAPLWQRNVTKVRTGTMSITVPATATSAQVLTLEKAALARRAGVPNGTFAPPRLGHTTTLANIVPVGAWSASTPSGKGYALKGQIEVGARTR